MSVSKQYTVNFPLVLTAKDYHDFDTIAEIMSKTLKENVEYTEIGFDFLYYAAFYPKSYELTDSEIETLQSELTF